MFSIIPKSSDDLTGINHPYLNANNCCVYVGRLRFY